MSSLRFGPPVRALLLTAAVATQLQCAACERNSSTTSPQSSPHDGEEEGEQSATNGESDGPDTTEPKAGGPQMTTQELAARLDGMTYSELFMRLDDKAVDEIWADAGKRGLDEVIHAQDTSANARYLAAEILFRKDDGYQPGDPALVASAYAKALQKAELANPWGMPGELDEPSAKHVVGLGKPAVPALRELLNDNREIEYGGSKEATVGNAYEMRVKDFAAFYISEIEEIPFEMVEDQGGRDKEINKLVSAL